jgi:hypothetical protein
LNGVTEAERVKMLGGNGYLPDEWLNTMVEKVKSASVVMPKWKPFIRAMKKAFRESYRGKISERRQGQLLSDVVVNLLADELCMLIIQEDTRDYPLLRMIGNYISNIKDA